MSVLMVPPISDPPAPSLGPLVLAWIEANLCHGPGPLLGKPLQLTATARGLVTRMYEIWPQGHEQEGRRKFDTAYISLRKGLSKTELIALVALAELHPEAPVRFESWADDGSPRGHGILDPYIPLLATAEGQSERTTFAAAKEILLRSQVAGDFDIALSRIVRMNGTGYMEAVSTSPDARDGARTSFQVFDEPHRLTDDTEKETVETMKANVTKIDAWDAWSALTSTAFQPGQNSVAEDMHGYAEDIATGKVAPDPSFFYFHRQADDGHDLTDEAQVRKAIEEATGPDALGWAAIDKKLNYWRKPTTDRAYFERVILNRPVAGSLQIWTPDQLKLRAVDDGRPRRRTEIVLGFDGSVTRDATALIGCTETGYLFTLGIWERPRDAPEGWEVDTHEVDETVRQAMAYFKVRRAYADPSHWEGWVDQWNGLWPKTFAKWPTTNLRKTAAAIHTYVRAWPSGEATFDGNVKFIEHHGNARKNEIKPKDDEGKPMYLLAKDRREQAGVIDAAYAGMLAWTARSDEVSDGWLKRGGSKAGRTTVAFPG